MLRLKLQEMFHQGGGGSKAGSSLSQCIATSHGAHHKSFKDAALRYTAAQRLDCEVRDHALTFFVACIVSFLADSTLLDASCLTAEITLTCMPALRTWERGACIFWAMKDAKRSTPCLMGGWRGPVRTPMRPASALSLRTETRRSAHHTGLCANSCKCCRPMPGVAPGPRQSHFRALTTQVGGN